MKLIVFFSLSFSFVAIGTISGAETSIELKARTLIADSITSDLSIVGSDRAAVIALLDEVATGKIDHIGVASAAQDNAQIVLMRLGDDQTIQQVVAQYQQYNSSYVLSHIPDMLEWSKQPATITYLASDFYLNDDASQSINLKENWETVGVPARSIYSGVIALEIIKRAPEFSEEMKAWAKVAYALRLKDPSKFKRLMQAWWNENKNAFTQRNYSAVHPVDINSFEASAPASVQPLPQEIKPTTKPPEPAVQIPIVPVPAPQVQPSMGLAIPAWIYGSIVLSLVIIVGLWYFLRPKK